MGEEAGNHGDMPQDSAGDELRVRRSKLQRYVDSGKDPYKPAYKTPEELSGSEEIRAEFASLEPGTGSGRQAAVAGRLMARRKHGKATFADLQDSQGRIQILLRTDRIGNERYEEFLEMDLGDWIGVEGEVVNSRTGELTIAVERFELLSKSLRPLPEKWHGLRDRETRYRQRYLDLVMNQEAREVLKTRAAVVRELRRFLDDRRFVEVETPMLQQIPGGATARPFVTHHNALGMDLYLRVAPELFLKRLLIGGYDRVYEINRNFRNEGISARHNPEFTMLEAYQAFVDYRYLMGFIQEMVLAVVRNVKGTTDLEYGGQRIDMSPPWKTITMVDALVEYADLEVDISFSREKLSAIADEREVEVPDAAGPGWIIAELYEKLVEPKLIQPTFVTEYPEEISPLSRRDPAAEGFTERFELLVAGQEIANAFSELTDPFDQRGRFEAQARQKAAGVDEAHPVDEDFLLAMEYGMPPAGGLGLGVDRLTMLITGCRNIRDVILFPHLRPPEGRL